MAVTMFLNAFTGIPGVARFLNYNAMTGTTRAALCAQHPSCVVCSLYGAFAPRRRMAAPGSHGLIMDFPERNSFLIIGDFPLDEFQKEFTQRKLAPHKVTIETAPEFLNLAKAILVVDHPSKFALLKEAFPRIFPQAEDHGLAIAVIAHSEDDHDQIAGIIDKKVSPTARIIPINQIHEAAELFCSTSNRSFAGTSYHRTYNTCFR